jgi:hypothetical protein
VEYPLVIINGNYDGISMGLKLVTLLIIQDLFMVTQALGGDADRPDTAAADRRAAALAAASTRCCEKRWFLLVKTWENHGKTMGKPMGKPSKLTLIRLDEGRSWKIIFKW